MRWAHGGSFPLGSPRRQRQTCLRVLQRRSPTPRPAAPLGRCLRVAPRGVRSCRGHLHGKRESQGRMGGATAAFARVVINPSTTSLWTQNKCLSGSVNTVNNHFRAAESGLRKAAVPRRSTSDGLSFLSVMKRCPIIAFLRAVSYRFLKVPRQFKKQRSLSHTRR